MRRKLYFVMALALVLGFTQCKKEQVNTPENETKTVNITLNVGGNGGGSRHDINTTTGAVDFKDGDVIYVGDGSTYIGTLTRTDGVFSGPINEPADETEIYFYFVGGLTPSATPEKGTTPSFTVDISDQSTKMPVLSCNHVTYYSSTTSYSCKLENQCALVKFTTASTTDPVHVDGLYTVAQIDFASNSITNNGTTGFVALNSKSETEKWAVLLPQTGFEGAEAAIAHVGYTTTIPNIEADAFITGNDAVSISTQSNIVYLDWLTSNYTATNGQTLKGKLGANVKISIADDATVTLDGVTINGVNNNNYAWAGLNCVGDATIILKDGTTNTVKGFYEVYPGIQPAEGYTLTINGGAAGTGKLTASSNGVGAGIGGGYDIPCGNIEIQGGDITANGGPIAAGIGSSSGESAANCGTITIIGGTVTATGGEMAAGIGSGCFNANCGTITITGGTVTATGGEGADGAGAAGIGSGFYEASCGDITITGGTVMANGGVNAAGIGSGYYASCDAITISGGTVSATGGERGAGIGSGNDNASCGNITISGGTVSATGGSDAAGIGSGNMSYCDAITITTGVTQVTATKGNGAPNSIGAGGNYGTCGTVTIGCTLDEDGNPVGGTVYPDGISDSPYTYQP